jgi:Yip1 domain
MASLTERMLGAAKLDAATYEEVEGDQTATGQALLVVVLANLAAGIGVAREMGLRGLVGTTILAVVGWYVWALVTYFVGTRWMPGGNTRADLGQVLRTTGFSSTPGLLRVLGVIPGLGGVSALVAAVWMLAGMLVAIRQALDYESTGRAIAVCLLGFLVYFVILMVVGRAIGVTAGLFGR